MRAPESSWSDLVKPLTVFNAHFRAAEGLLKLYRLLDSEAADGQHALMGQLRDIVQVRTDEEVVLLFNDLFTGLVREQAQLPSSFFRQPNLALLLRQSVVSACTALDVFFPALLEAHLPVVIRVRQRNWQPTDNDARDLLRDFRVKVEELPGLLEAETAEERWQLFAARVIGHLGDKTLSNPQGIQATLAILGVDDPWQKIASTSGITAAALRGQIQSVVKRRNNIVHRGDRASGDMDNDPDPIDYAWANAHVNAINSTATACDSLAQSAVRELVQAAGVA